MPLGVRDVLLVIRAKDQASRAIGDVGRSFGNLGRKQQAILKDSQKSMLQFNRQSAKIKSELGGQLRSQIGSINTQMRQNSLASAQLATRNAKLRADYMNLHGASKKAALQEMLTNDVRRKQLAEFNSAFSKQALGIRQTSDRTLRTQLGDIEKLKSAEMDLRRSRMEAIQERQNRGASRMGRGQAIGGVGVGITAVGVGGLAFFASAAKEAMKYRDEAAKTLTQVDTKLKASVTDIEKIGVRVAKAVPVPFKQMQESLYDIFSSLKLKGGLPEAERLLVQFSKGAIAGATDVKTASAATISLMNGFKIESKDIERVLDMQFRTVKEGRITYDEFAKSIGRAIPSAVTAGQSMEDLGGMMAFLTRNGLSAAMSATSAARAFDLIKNPKFLKSMKTLGLSPVFTEGPNKDKFRPMLDIMNDLKDRMKGMSSPQLAKTMADFMGSVSDPKALNALKDMGIQIKTIAKPGVAAAMRPIADIMGDLEKKLKEATPAAREQIMAGLTKGSGGTIQAMRFVNLALTDSNDLLGELTGSVRNSGGAFKTAYGIMRDTPGAKIQALKNKWETFRQELGVHVIPIALKLIDKLSGIAKWLGNLDESTKKNIVKWGLIGGAILTLMGVLTILSGMILIISGAFTLLATSGLAMTLLGFGKFVAFGLAAKKMLESTNPLIQALGAILAGLAAKALLGSIASAIGLVGTLAGKLLGVQTAALGAGGALAGIGKSLGSAAIIGGGIAVLNNRLQFNQKQAGGLVGRTVEGKNTKDALAAVREQIAAQKKLRSGGISQSIGPVNLFSSNEARKAADAVDLLIKKERELVGQLKQDKADKGIAPDFAKTFNSAASFVQAFGGEVDAAKIKVKDFFNQQLVDAKGWAADIEFLNTKKIDPGFMKQLVEAGPSGMAMVKAVRGEIEAGNLDFVNNSIAELDRLKAKVASTTTEAINLINGTKPKLTIDVEANFGGGLNILDQMKNRLATNPPPKSQPRTGYRGWGGWPRREHGGLVTAGKSYIVGERRAEMFTPRQSGRITPRVPSGSSTGGNTYNKRIVINPKSEMSAAEIADSVSWALRHQ